MSATVSKSDMIRVLGDLAAANSGDELATKVLEFGARLKAGEFDVAKPIMCATCGKELDLTRTIVYIGDGTYHHPQCYLAPHREREPSAVRCQKCGYTGVPSPTVVLDLEAEIRDLKAALAASAVVPTATKGASHGSADAQLRDAWRDELRSASDAQDVELPAAPDAGTPVPSIAPSDRTGAVTPRPTDPDFELAYNTLTHTAKNRPTHEYGVFADALNRVAEWLKAESARRTSDIPPQGAEPHKGWHEVNEAGDVFHKCLQCRVVVVKRKSGIVEIFDGLDGQPSEDTKRLDKLFHLLPFAERHRFGGDVQEFRQGIDAARPASAEGQR